MSALPWNLPLFLARTAWAGLPHDALSDVVAEAAPAQLVTVLGDPDPQLRGVDFSRGPVPILHHLVAVLRRSAHRPVPEVLSLLSTSPGDVSSLPSVAGLATEIGVRGYGILVRDQAGRGIAVSAQAAGPEVLRWTVRSIEQCPVAPQPLGVASAGSALSAAVREAADLISTMADPGWSTGGTLDLDFPPSPLPPGLPLRVVDLLDRCERVEAIVGAAVRLRDTGRARAQREPVVRRLRSAVDAALRSAVTEAAGEARRAPGVAIASAATRGRTP